MVNQNPARPGLTHRDVARPEYDLICFSHLRWDFVFQRPQHLMTRCAAGRRVFFVEEPLFDSSVPRLDLNRDRSGVCVAVPRLPSGRAPADVLRDLRGLVDRLVVEEGLEHFVTWYYTPMALAFSDHLEPIAVVYDCMDELAGFAGAPSGISDAEQALLRRADVVFTGGESLFEAKRHRHANIHPFPSSVDVPHFAAARGLSADPSDQAAVPHPRIGFCGVIDERLDIPLLDAAARARPEWQFVLVGPVVKIDPGLLPRGRNLHYLGPKTYAQLPSYLAGWDVAMLPFARNEATRFISPTKTPEYLAAGKPVISTSIRDVVRPYGELGLARIADTPADFVQAVEALLADAHGPRQRLADAFLSRLSWDRTWAAMCALITAATEQRRPARTVATATPARHRSRGAPAPPDAL